ncbi:MAG: ABC transporter permease subunit [Pirellulaceae bacterium]
MIIACLSLVVLALLLSAITFEGVRFLSFQFLIAAPGPEPAEAGIGPSLGGTIWVCAVCAFMTLPVGVATAVLLEEFKPRNIVLRWLHGFLQLNIANLAGVPSVVYGIIGLTAFVAMFGLFGSVNDPVLELGASYYDQFVSEGDLVAFVPVSGPQAPETEPRDGMTAYTSSGQPFKMIVADRQTFDFNDPANQKNMKRTFFTDSEPGRVSRKSWYFIRIPFGRGVLAGSLTLMLVVLPIVIISTQEALRAVPDSLRAGALGMGSTPWQVVWHITLPAAVPGIMTGAILAMSRAIGEAAPILMIAGIVYIGSAPGNLMDDFSVMPLQIFTWASRPQAAFHSLAASGIIVLLAMLLAFNAVAVLIRHKMQKPLT